MFNLSTDIKVRKFEYFYLWIMVIYMSQMLPETKKMSSGLDISVSFLLPIILTVVLCLRNKISFYNKSLAKVLLLLSLWVAAIVVKYKSSILSNPSQLSYYFFLYYSVIVAYIHIKVFDKKLVNIYEDIIVKLSLVSLFLWGIGQLIPMIPASVYSQFTESGRGYNILYTFKWMYGTENSYRNAGCSWEPGMFSCIVILAINCNILRMHKIRLRNNPNLIILTATLISTFSTTGYIASIVLLFYIKHWYKIKDLINTTLIIIPVTFIVMQFDFMYKKIEKQMDLSNYEDFTEIAYYADIDKEKGEYVSSVSRFQTLEFQMININNDPVLGYGLSRENSFFYNNISSHFSLPGGLLAVFANFGMILGFILYYMMYKSSASLVSDFSYDKRKLFFFTMILTSVSYNIFTIPVFMYFWLYKYFKNPLLKV